MGIRERKIGQEKSMLDGVLHLQVRGRSREEGSTNLIPEVDILERTKKKKSTVFTFTPKEADPD